MLNFMIILCISPSLWAKSKVPKDPHTRLAVLEFRDEAQLPPFERALLADSVRGAALNTPFQVMTKENMITLLPPGQTLEDCIGECEVDVGRKLGAHYIITGMIGRLEGELQLLLRLYETREGNLKGQVTVSAVTVGQLQPKVAQASIQILEKLTPNFKQIDAFTRTLLFIEYKPKHTQIKIDGHMIDMRTVKKVGKGVMLPISEGKHKIEASAKGYLKMRKRIRINTGQPHQVTINLQRSYSNKACYTGACSGDLFVYSKPPGAKIYLNGKNTGKITKPSSHDPRLGSLALSIPSGKYWVSARKRSYRSAEKLIEIKAGDTYNGFRHKPLVLRRSWSHLKLTSKPRGAIVRINGAVVGKTPFERKNLQAKPYWIELIAEGYQSKEKLVLLKAGRTWKQHWKLRSTRTELKVHVTYRGKSVVGASVWINDQLMGESDAQGKVILKELPHGAVDVQVRHPLYVAYQSELQIKPGESINKKIKLQGAFAYLSITLPKDTSIQHVIWAGQNLGHTKIIEQQVPAGSYWLQIRPSDEEQWQPYRKKMHLEVGESKKIKPQFMPHRAWLKVKSIPKGAQVYLDQQAMGKTPIKIRSTAGPHRLKVIVDDQPPYQQSIVLKKGKNVQMVDFSQRTLVELSCKPSHSTLRLNGNLLGAFPQKIDIEAGQHEMSCSLGAVFVNEVVNIKRGEHIKKHLQLDPNMFRNARRRKQKLAWVGKGILVAGIGSVLTGGALWLGPMQNAMQERNRKAQSWIKSDEIDGRTQAFQSWSVADQQAQYYNEWAQRSTMIGAILSAIGAGIWTYAHYSQQHYPKYSTSQNIHSSF